MIYLSFLIIGLYTILILDLFTGFKKLPVFKPGKSEPLTRFSVLIPFRNEAKNLSGLLKSLSRLNYPKDLFEVILINDESSDAFRSVIASFSEALPVKLIDSTRKSGSPKKDALEKGIETAAYEWIVTTDADCIVPENWLRLLDAFIRKNHPVFVAAPVMYKVKKQFVEQFQQIDILSLQGSTIGGFGIGKPFLCNGANLAYRKDAFYRVNGFDGNKNIAGGDDIFLLEKMTNQFPDSTLFLKNPDASVLTFAQPTWTALFRQRIRWAAKTTAYKNRFGKTVGLIVFTANAYLVVLFILAVLHQISWPHFGMAFLIKFNVDFALIYLTARFFKIPHALKKYLISSIVYPVFSVYVALRSLLTGFIWRDRTFKQ